MSDMQDNEQPAVALPSSDAAEPRAARRASREARGDPQHIEGTEGGEPVTMEGIAGGEPVEVKFADESEPRPALLVTKGQGKTLAPDTTEEADRVTEGQREINKIWEYTQAIIAVSITGAVIYVSVMEIESQILTSGFFLIIGFYFSRVNHQNIGGIGRKATDYPEPYRGR